MRILRVCASCRSCLFWSFTQPVLPLALQHMRMIGHLAEETSARTFGDYLYVQGIENQLEHEKSAGWGIWIKDEDKLERATQLLTEFQADPKNKRYGSE